MRNPEEKTHILIIPYPSQGHMIPILDLTNHLANTKLFKLTILTTPKNLHLLSPLISSYPTTVTPLVLPLPEVSGFVSGVENTKDHPPGIFRQMMFALSKLENPVRDWFGSLVDPPVGVISDFFMGWTQRFADSLGIKRVVFSPSGGMGLSVIYALWKDMVKEMDFVLFEDLPKLPKYPWWQLSTVYRSYVDGEEISEVIKEGFKGNLASWGLVVNSFDDLENEYLSHLKCVLGHDRVWAVGPLFNGSGSVQGDDEVLSWLDTCCDDEVVYVSFGTQALLTSGQMEAVAKGLEMSGVRFIWVARESEGGKVPCGFVDRVKGRGIVITGWAPQVSILRHRAVGVFLTHCGWNSVIEAITGGVMLLTWPMGADQFTNATLLVDYLKVGVRVCEGPRSIPDPVDFSRILADSVGKQGEFRQRMIQVRDNAQKAVGENGSSSKELESLVKSLTGLSTKA